jgi:hypothetical protein
MAKDTDSARAGAVVLADSFAEDAVDKFEILLHNGIAVSICGRKNRDLFPFCPPRRQKHQFFAYLCARRSLKIRL